jgi:N utilization substance protein B
MGSRRRAREAALQALYQLHLNPGLLPEQALANVFDTLSRGPDGAADEIAGDMRVFASRLLGGVAAERERLDEVLTAASTHWRLDRMAAVDRNLLRLATFELLFEADIPASVTIDEALEIAKRFGTADSPAFINGVLQRVAADAKNK